MLKPTPSFFSNSWLFIICVAVPLIFVPLFPTIPTAHAQVAGDQIIGFYANLSGKEEVPPTESNATGLAVFLFSNESSELSYLVNLTGLEDITDSNINNGSSGSNGEILASLDSTSEESNSSLIMQREIKNEKLKGQFEGK
jgi:hypothetical protein